MSELFRSGDVLGNVYADNYNLISEATPPGKSPLKHHLLLGKGNATWVAATLIEMANSENHREAVVALLNDPGFRKFGTSGYFGQLMPKFAEAVNGGTAVTRENLAQILPQSSDKLMERYQLEIEPQLPAKVSDNLEIGMPPRIVADVLRVARGHLRRIDPNAETPSFLAIRAIICPQWTRATAFFGLFKLCVD